jgi:Cu-Zn family superoxide dismutase
MKNNTLTKLALTCLIATFVTGCACSDSRKPVSKSSNEIAALDSTKATAQDVKMATAKLKGLKDSNIQGVVTFTQQPDGVLIVGEIDGLAPGKHGFHIHEFGDCGKDGAATGAHFNPTNKKHGGPDSPDRHVGDLGNLLADSKGHAHYEKLDKVISLNGKDSIVGRSLVIHVDEDDFKTQPTGASGDKLACGVIVIGVQ